MAERDKKTTLLLKAARSLIDDSELNAARAVLDTIAHDPQAKTWLKKLGPQKASSSLLLWSGLVVAIILCLVIGFVTGRASMPSAPQADSDSSVSTFTQDDALSVTADVQAAQTQQVLIEASNEPLEDAFAQTQAAVIASSTQSAVMTGQALATWIAGATATQTARDS